MSHLAKRVMASTLRTKRYRRFLFTENELLLRRSELEAQLLPLACDWREGRTADYEVVALYILRFLKVMRPHDYLGGPHNESISTAPTYTPAVQIFAHHSLRSVPLAVNRAIVGWAEGRYQLKLYDYILDAESLLKMQIQGERAVTCLFKAEELVKWIEDSRDPLGFVLHDLIHADHFFRDPELALAQQEFYARVFTRMNAGEFDALLASNSVFAEKFEYVISDMNSHPLHLEQTLDAILREALQ